MFMFNNMQLFGDWQSAYHTLLHQFQQLQHDYQASVRLQRQLTAKVQQLTKQNLEMEKKLAQQERMVPIKGHPTTSALISQPQNEITSKMPPKTVEKRNKAGSKRDRDSTEVGDYHCTYPDCDRVYSSPVSMNLHIKIKHNGGTKKEREAYAKRILDAQARGQEPPQLDINLPPNFVEEFRTSYEYMKKYSM